MSQSAAKIIESWKSEDISETTSSSPAGHIRLVSSAGELRKQSDEVQAYSATCYSTSCYSDSCYSTNCYSTTCYSTNCYSQSCYSTNCSTVLSDCG